MFVVGILQHPDGTVLKQLQPPPRGPREMQFYSMVMSIYHMFAQKAIVGVFVCVVRS